VNSIRTIALFLLTLLCVVGGVVLWLYYRLWRRGQRDFSVKRSPALSGTDAVVVEGLGLVASPGLDGVSTAGAFAKSIGSTPIPMTRRSFYDASDRVGILGKISSTFAKYGEFIEEAAVNSAVSLELMKGLQFVENADADPNVVTSADATGLYQVSPANATDTIIRMRKKRLLSQAEKDVLRAELGTARYNRLMSASLGTAVLTVADLKKPRLNCTVAGIVLSELLNEHGDGRFWRFDELVVRYNRGYYTRLPQSQNTDELLTKLSGTTRDYILKLTGANGTLDLLT